MCSRFIFRITTLLMSCLWIAPAAGSTGDFHVTDYGALGDGQTVNTVAIQDAINACAQQGGGRVVIGPGEFVTGTLDLRDHVELHIARGGTLLGSTSLEDYPDRVTQYRYYGDSWARKSLLFADGLTDIAITGAGTIDGRGGAFVATTNRKPDRYMNRPYVIRFIQCRGVTVKDVTLRNSAMWMQHYLACDDVLIDGIRVYNHCNKNNDMMDIDGCRNVVIRDCTGDTDDDALTLKSTSPRACENVTISGCVISSHCNAIKMGTESTGGFRNITISDCVIRPSADRGVIYGYPDGISGISLEVVDGGTMEGISVSDVVMDGPEVPLFIRLGNRARPHKQEAPAPEVGTIDDIVIRNITARNGGSIGCSVTGIPGHPAGNITLKDLDLRLEGGVLKEIPPGEVPEHEDMYPEATMFGQLPASVFYLRHLEGVLLENIRVELDGEDTRDHVVADDVKDFEILNFRVDGTDRPRIRKLNMP